jgi:predicted 2-oxoglutarate/Fe(II)-dependent dioxygenase YbiX/peroxiredoxin
VLAATPIQRLTYGDPLPTFGGRTNTADRFSIGNQAGRFLVFCLFGSVADENARRTIDAVIENRNLFDDIKVSFFGVSTDPDDEQQQRVKPLLPGIRYFWDFDHAISRLLGAYAAGNAAFNPQIVVADPQLRVYAALPFEADGAHIAKFIALLKALPDPGLHAGVPMQAPVLIVPRVFEPMLCEKLINLYETGGGSDSGFMRDVDGRTVGIIDHRMKRRSDHEIQDRDVRMAMQRRISRRLIPEIQKAFQFKVTRIERYIVACYDSDGGGYFKPHRDNTTKGTAHRRFAVTINLNTGDYSGGGLNFPEYGPQVYHAPRGGAVVFSCSLLHQALPILSGKRYATLPFLYDETAAQLRRENMQFLDRRTKGAAEPEYAEEGGEEGGEAGGEPDQPAARVAAPR